MHSLTFFPSKTYLVKRGQTISDVCSAFGVSPYALISLNELDCWKEGVVLLLPPKGTEAPKWYRLSHRGDGEDV
ncbi:MAG: LysM peptidoglycan-binding domain-containing protein [Clostridia bacterium]|nr:LysM peptidoglycan-binding domain-containing protein [Clostridia bacterium]